jgi:hypothetical protein
MKTEAPTNSTYFNYSNDDCLTVDVNVNECTMSIEGKPLGVYEFDGEDVKYYIDTHITHRLPMRTIKAHLKQCKGQFIQTLLKKASEAAEIELLTNTESNHE